MARPNTYPKKTSFPAGAGFVGDSDAGVFFMEANPLLALTSQDALAGNVAPAFDPTASYNFGDKVIYQGILKRAKNSVSAGAYNSSDWESITEANANQYTLSSSNLSYLNDLNNFPQGSSVTCTNAALLSSISHLPIIETFVVYTLESSSSAVTVQIFASSTSKKIFFRRRWSTWSDWFEIGEINTRAFAKCIATAFSTSSSYSAGDLVEKDGTLYRAKTAISAGSFDSSKWEEKNVFNALYLSVTAANVASFSDLDSYPLNTVALVSNDTVASSISNKPMDGQFLLYTMAYTGLSTIAFQIFMSKTDKRVFFRGRWTTWSSWQEIVGNAPKSVSIAPDFSNSATYKCGDVIMVDGQLKRALKDLSAGSYNNSDWENKNLFNAKNIALNASNITYLNSADKFPLGYAVLCTNSTLLSSISNLPESTQFVAYTFESGNAAVTLQLFVPNNSSKLYYRRKWNTWSQWKEIAVEPKNEPETVNPLVPFDNFVCIGDSLTWCQVYYGSGVADQRQAKKLWGDILAYNCNATAQTIASPGDTAATSWPRVDASLTAKTNALTIVYLGTNAGLTDTLDTDAPEGVPYTSWADTNTGCYAKIVAKAQSLGYKVMLIKPWAGGGDSLATTQDVIDQIGARFGCCVVEPFHTDDMAYHYWPNLSGNNQLHYNDLGYAWFATALPYYASRAGSDQLKYIIPSN